MAPSDAERLAPEQTGNKPQCHCLGGTDASHLAPKEPILQAPRDGAAPTPAVAQAKIDLVLQDVADNAGLMIGALHCVLAMRDADDVVGLLYSLRRAHAYWKSIAASTRDLIAADAERLSALRQGEAAR